MESLKPTEAVRRLFDDHPNYKWNPGELRDELTSMKKRDELLTNAQDMLQVAHWVLRRLLKDDYIEPGGKNRKRWYRKFQKEKISLK